MTKDEVLKLVNGALARQVGIPPCTVKVHYAVANEKIGAYWLVPADYKDGLAQWIIAMSLVAREITDRDTRRIAAKVEYDPYLTPEAELQLVVYINKGE